ncbi:hypothetical protein PVAND_000249 [Polypedilum vanderplanki]|uniref:Uricase n=1 Tax=Polypedilum vanderplanki TaxID=319348 RepID=A0A9J6BJS0_POLVA|nr:hypothetical protein PVAND_000249 [Polypedilum vanderplanki]
MSCDDFQDGPNKYKISGRKYGKNEIRIFYVNKDGPCHIIKELLINTRLTLETNKEYISDDNTGIIDTKSQRNSVYILAKKHGIKTTEDFGTLVCSYYLSTYSHVKTASLYIEEENWERLSYDDETKGKLHNHAFMLTPKYVRTTVIVFNRGDEFPTISNGIKNLRIIKTTQNSFKNFSQNEHRSIADAEERTLCLLLTFSWTYKQNPQIDFCKTFNSILHVVLYNFAGDLEKGTMLTSVQNTIFMAAKKILDKVEEIEFVEVVCKNFHYDLFDFEIFKIPNEVNDVFYPQENPSEVHIRLDRK